MEYWSIGVLKWIRIGRMNYLFSHLTIQPFNHLTITPSLQHSITPFFHHFPITFVRLSKKLSYSLVNLKELTFVFLDINIIVEIIVIPIIKSLLILRNTLNGQ